MRAAQATGVGIGIGDWGLGVWEFCGPLLTDLPAIIDAIAERELRGFLDQWRFVDGERARDGRGLSRRVEEAARGGKAGTPEAPQGSPDPAKPGKPDAAECSD